MQGKVKALTAQGMAQGVLVGSMPIGMLLIFSFIDANYVRPLFTTVLGWVILAVVLILDAAGVLLMFKLVKVDV